jgi:hypothetical protein
LKVTNPSLNDIDLLADSSDLGTSVPDSPALKQVSGLVAEYDRLNQEISILEGKVKERELRRKEIEEQLMPNSMMEAGLTSFRTATGRNVLIDTVVRGNIPALSTIEKAKGDEKRFLLARRDSAISIVRQKWPGLIKTELTVALGRGQAEVALRVAELLRNQFQLDPEIAENIHPATLNSHFKELKADGKLEEIPVEPFALYVGPIAKIK